MIDILFWLGVAFIVYEIVIRLWIRFYIRWKVAHTPIEPLGDEEFQRHMADFERQENWDWNKESVDHYEKKNKKENEP